MTRRVKKRKDTAPVVSQVAGDDGFEGTHNAQPDDAYKRVPAVLCSGAVRRHNGFWVHK